MPPVTGAFVAAVLSLLLSILSIVSFLIQEETRSLAFGSAEAGLNVGPFALLSFIFQIISILAGLFVVMFFIGKGKNEKFAFGANLIGLLSSILTFIYFFENIKISNLTDGMTIPFQWGHGTQIASIVCFLTGAILTYTKR